MPYRHARVFLRPLVILLLFGSLMTESSYAQDTVLLDQVDDFDGSFIAMQNQDTADLSAATADDFIVPEGTSWTIRTVFIDGYYVVSPNNPDGQPECTSATLGFWTHATDRPGDALVLHENLDVASDDSGQMTFVIEEMRLESGTYWLSFQCAGNLGTNQNGARLFYWNRNDNGGRNTALGYTAVSSNPGGGLQFPASGWNSLVEINGYESGLDMSFRLSGSSSASTNNEDAAVPTHLSLGPAYPNPFNDSFSVEYVIDQPTHVDLVVYDVMGRVHASLSLGMVAAGSHRATFAGTLPGNGQYFIRMTTTSGMSQVRSVTFLR